MLNARVIALALLTAVGAGCATASVSGTFPPTTHSDTGPMRLFVMPAGFVRSPGTGNVGVSFADVQRRVDERVLAIARERDPGATLTPIDGTAPYRPSEPYIAAAVPAAVTAGELNAAGYARQHGGTHLLVPTILEWRQMRTDDPIGGFIEPHNRIAIELRLVQLNPARVDGDVTFSNHARTTLNQSANGLLDEEFRKVVKRLLVD